MTNAAAARALFTSAMAANVIGEADASFIALRSSASKSDFLLTVFSVNPFHTSPAVGSTRTYLLDSDPG